MSLQERIERSKKIYSLDDLANVLIVVLDTLVTKKIIGDDIAASLWTAAMLGLLESDDIGETINDA